MKPEFWRSFVLGLVFWTTVLVVLFLFCRSTDAQQWNWSPPAKHHQAAVQVHSSSGRKLRSFSGVYVQHGKVRGVLTVAHGVRNDVTGVVSPTATVTFIDGMQKTGQVALDKFRHDIACVLVQHPQIVPLRIASSAPRAGERVEFVTHGGPESNRLRHFYAETVSVGARETRYNCYVINGDSGGAILNLRAEVVGIQVGAWQANRVSAKNQWAVYNASRGASCRPIRDFLFRGGARWREGQCQPVLPGPGAGGRSFYPPAPPARQSPVGRPPQGAVPFSHDPDNPPPDLHELPRPRQLGPDGGRSPPQDEKPVCPLPSPIQVTPLPEPPPEINYEKLVALVFARMIASPEGFHGLGGAVGPQGPRGQDGPRGEQGLQGKTGGAGPTPAINLDDLTAQVLLGLQEKPLFYVVHKNPETGKAIPYSDPETGEVLITQAVQWGDTYILYLHKRSNLQQVQP